MGLGIKEILLILIVVLVLFGAGKLPKVMHDLGVGMRNFKKALNGKEESESEIKTLESDEKNGDEKNGK